MEVSSPQVVSLPRSARILLVCRALLEALLTASSACFSRATSSTLDSSQSRSVRSSPPRSLARPSSRWESGSWEDAFRLGRFCSERPA